MRVFLYLLNRFIGDRSGNVAVIFAIASVPILTAVGSAVDYSRATQIRAKLQASIDAASVGSVSKSSPGFIAAGSMTSDGPIPAGVTDATNIFNANMNGVPGYTLNSMTPVMTKKGGVITSTLLTLVVIPTFYEILDEWREKLLEKVGLGKKRAEAVVHGGAGPVPEGALSSVRS